MSFTRNFFLLKTFAIFLGLSLSYSQTIDPASFFFQINIIPHGHFKNFLCGIFRQNPGPYGDNRVDQIVFKTDFKALENLLQSWNPLTRKNPFFYSEFDLDNSIKHYYQKLSNKQARNRLFTGIYYLPQTSFQHRSRDYFRLFLSLKFHLQSGLGPTQLKQLKSTLLLSVTMQDLDFLFDLIYVEIGISSDDVLDVIQYFFAEDPNSSARSLADVDRRRAFIEIILVANGRAPCPKCPVYFQDFRDVSRAVFWNLLPQGSFEDTRVAVTGMLALSEARFRPQGLINIFDVFLQGFVNSNPNEPSRSLNSNGDKELYKLSKEAACYALVKFLTISETCKAPLPTRFATVYILCNVTQKNTTDMLTTTVATTTSSITETTTVETMTEATTAK